MHGPGSAGGGTLLSHHWRLIVAITAATIATSFFVTYFTSSTKWEASDLVRVGPPTLQRDFSGDPAYTNQVLQTVQQIASDPAVVEDAWREAGVAPSRGESDPNTVTVEARQDSELLRFSVTDEDPERAQGTLQAMLTESESAVDRIYGRSLSFTPVAAVGQVSEVGPPYLLNGIAAGVAGLLLGFAFAALVERGYAL
jgi:capsular polysaccharide biosynthesis protein